MDRLTTTATHVNPGGRLGAFLLACGALLAVLAVILVVGSPAAPVEIEAPPTSPPVFQDLLESEVLSRVVSAALAENLQLDPVTTASLPPADDVQAVWIALYPTAAPLTAVDIQHQWLEKQPHTAPPQALLPQPPDVDRREQDLRAWQRTFTMLEGRRRANYARTWIDEAMQRRAVQQVQADQAAEERGWRQRLLGLTGFGAGVLVLGGVWSLVLASRRRPITLVLTQAQLQIGDRAVLLEDIQRVTGGTTLAVSMQDGELIRVPRGYFVDATFVGNLSRAVAAAQAGEDRSVDLHRLRAQLPE